MAERQWVLLAYTVPRKPSASRVYVWRKLKSLGAIALQDAVWVLPDTPRCLEQFRWLAAEVVELGGEATVWNAKLISRSQEQSFVRKFEAQVEVAYREILAKLASRSDELDLSRQFQVAQSRDFFGSKLGRQVRRALLRRRDGRNQ